VSKYVFIVAASKEYAEPVRALINSINIHHKCIDFDIHVLDYGVGSLLKDLGNIRLVSIPAKYTPKQKAVMSYRHLYAATVKDEGYTAACLLDADMFFLRDVSKYLRITEKAHTLIAASDCVNVLLHKPHRDRVAGALTANFYNTKTITTVPLFFAPAVHSEVFRTTYEWAVANNEEDLFCLNLALCANKPIWDNMLVLSAHAWTGIHHSMLKPNNRLRFIEPDTKYGVKGQYLAESGEEVFAIHGRWFDPLWVEGLKTTMREYYMYEFGMSGDSVKKHMRQTQGSIDLSLAVYNQYLRGEKA